MICAAVPPYVTALAYMGREDYMRGGYRMLSHPMYDPTGRRLAGVALRNAVYLLPLGVVAVAAGLTTAPFAYEAAGHGPGPSSTPPRHFLTSTSAGVCTCNHLSSHPPLMCAP